MVVGRVPPEVQRHWEQHSDVPIIWAGLQPPERIPELDRSAHLLYSADLNAACPNAVIEALACGLPVVAFDTGALRELVTGDAGRVVPYGGDPWRLETPDLPALSQAALEILNNQERFRLAARQRADAAFGLDEMVEKYLEVLL
jgi:glycosyltransferase involved in cell wall biosynthesis